MIDLDAIEARARAVPFDVIPHGPQPGGGLLLCFTDDADTDVGRVYGPHEVAVANLLAHARTDSLALIAEVRHLRATTLPARIDAPDGHTAEVVSVRVRRATPTGGTWHESMSVDRWRRQGNVREELRDSGGGGDREG